MAPLRIEHGKLTIYLWINMLNKLGNPALPGYLKNL